MRLVWAPHYTDRLWSVNGHNDRWDVDTYWWSVQMKWQDGVTSRWKRRKCAHWKLFLSCLYESDIYQKVAGPTLTASAVSTSVDVCSARGLCCMLSLQMSVFFFSPSNSSSSSDCWSEASRGLAFNKLHLCLIKPRHLYLWVSVNTEGGWDWNIEWLLL